MAKFNRAIILGSSGMLGHEVLKAFTNAGVETLEISRQNRFDFNQPNEAENRLLSYDLGPSDLIVNCVGWIPQKASGNSNLDVQSATCANILLPQRLEVLSGSKKVSVIQILTDCVFSGESGSYDENSQQDSGDLYGLTKRLGEFGLEKTMAVRCSIIGKSRNSGVSLVDWFLSQRQGAEIDGYTNHLWNGVTTIAFARLALGLFKMGKIMPGKQHWIPKDSVSKLDLLMLLREFSGRKDIFIRPHANETSINRRIRTLNTANSETLWRVAGYSQVPSIAELVKEIFEGRGV